MRGLPLAVAAAFDPEAFSFCSVCCSSSTAVELLFVASGKNTGNVFVLCVCVCCASLKIVWDLIRLFESTAVGSVRAAGSQLAAAAAARRSDGKMAKVSF